MISSSPSDERAIAEAVAQVEKELEEEQFRENPSIWDLNPEIQDKKAENSIWEVNLKAIDEELKDIKFKKGKKVSSDNSTAEGEVHIIFSTTKFSCAFRSDDVAISEAIAEVERELEEAASGENPSIWETNLDIGRKTDDDEDSNKNLSPGETFDVKHPLCLLYLIVCHSALRRESDCSCSCTGGEGAR